MSMLSWPGHRWLALGGRLFLAAVLLAAWLPKVQDPTQFALQIGAYQILPVSMLELAAHGILWLELSLALLLLVGLFPRAGATVTALLLAVFFVAGTSALARGLELACGCFGGDSPLSAATLARDAAFIGVAVYVALVDRRPVRAPFLRSR